MISPDADAQYEQCLDIDLKDLPAQVACPHSVDNVKPVQEIAGTKIDQALIGSCTNGRLEDLRLAAEVLQDNKVHPGIRCIVIPGTQQVYLDALKEGIVEKFVKAGAAFSTPTCGPCLGGHMGVLAAGEIALATTNRNFVGRMGHTSSKVYLSNPAVAAATAVEGRIAHPDEVM